jgi:DNA-binding PadR family transcriptional regulator
MVSATDVVVLVTLSRNAEGCHGYELLRTVRTEQGTALATTTLYRCLRGLLERGLIDEVELAPGEDERRRRYRINAAGLTAARVEATRLKRLFASSPLLAGVLS